MRDDFPELGPVAPLVELSPLDAALTGMTPAVAATPPEQIFVPDPTPPPTAPIVPLPTPQREVPQFVTPPIQEEIVPTAAPEPFVPPPALPEIVEVPEKLSAEKFSTTGASFTAPQTPPQFPPITQ